jgi:4-amino-4-deoxy-L-arabinose transferase-like glycosyltransferase
MAFEKTVQDFVHKLEEGGWVGKLRLALLIGALGFMVYLWLFSNTGFKGLAHEKAMEQAQISREIARGHGFSTKMTRPAAMWLFQRNTGTFPVDQQPDIFHAPLHPWINSWFILLAKDSWQMTTKMFQYVPDKIIAGVGLAFFFLSVLVNYFTAQRLFDRRLALLGMGLMLLCERFWDFALSGLPQMLMLFLFSCAIHTLFRAVEARCEERSPLRWLIATGTFFGLLALAHGLTIWIFVGALIFTAIYFRPYGRHAAIMLAVFMLFYGPWMIRNQRVCGTFVGLGWYSGLYAARGNSESYEMRSMKLTLDDLTPRYFRSKVQTESLRQLDGLYAFLGNVVVAPVFFLALLHLFKRPATGVFRWCVLLMWSCAFIGMGVFGFSEKAGLNANDLHVLFIPIMAFYGLALVLVMWSRLQINARFIWIGFVAAIYLISALPFINQILQLLGPPTGRVAWPPYIPPYIAIMNGWTNEKEIIASDMPWAVSWYADRKSLWLPLTVKDFLDLNDYGRLDGRIVGLYLTPVTGNKAFISEIVKGEYKEWAQFIMRNVSSRDFPLKAVTAMPMENECVFYSDRDRWTNRED